MPPPPLRLMLRFMHSRIVFIESKPGRLVIDALTSDGQVLSMEAEVPAAMWGFAAALALGRWAEQGTQVVTDLYESRGSNRLRLSDDEHLVVLDLARPATVTAHAGEHLGKEGANRHAVRAAAGRVGR